MARTQTSPESRCTGRRPGRRTGSGAVLVRDSRHATPYGSTPLRPRHATPTASCVPSVARTR
ncbi:hypothetical protein AB0D46_03720 [Streptomyces sp. NPDC048383]|uniref:hypothetical protein n=1 Tax=Streptomyces sp. NPDC048383 TaxID=3155386 RepID=UPI00343CA638